LDCCTCWPGNAFWPMGFSKLQGRNLIASPMTSMHMHKRCDRRWLISGHTRAGYDLGTVTSVSLLAWTAPNLAAHSTNAVLATVAGLCVYVLSACTCQPTIHLSSLHTMMI
jgi:hypothetical protein